MFYMFHWLLAAVLSCLFVLDSAHAAPRADVYRRAKAATVLIAAINDSTHSVSMGSGFFVNDSGLLVTNAHVIEDHTRLYLYVQDQIIHSNPEVVAVDPDLDLAAIRIPQSGVHTLALVKEPPPEGTDVIAVGYPRITDILQMGFALHATIGSGTVSGMVQGRSRTKGRLAGFVQTTGILNFGNSGGPLVDTETGEVVGMVVTTVPYLERARDRNGTAIGSVSMKSGIGYSIPSTVISEWLRSHQLETRVSWKEPARTPRHGAEPEADRSFATGHLLQTIGMVLHEDADLLKLAISHYETAASLKPEAPEVARSLGQAYASIGHWDRALEVYLKGLEQAPQDAALLSDAVAAWHRIGHEERALESFRAALQVNPRSGHAHNTLGHLLREMGKLDEAIAEFRAAVRAEPTLSSAVYNLGSALEEKGLSAEAIRTWESFLKNAGSPSKQDEWTTKMREGLTRLKAAHEARFVAPAAAR